jgi:integrase
MTLPIPPFMEISMATISERGPFQFQAIVRRKGYPSQTKTFETRSEAKKWGTVIESEMHRGIFIERTECERTTLKEALERYLKEKTPHKRSNQQEIYRIRAWQKHPLAMRSLASLRTCDFAEYRDDRLVVVSRNTVRLEMAIISHLCTVAISEWSLPIERNWIVAGLLPKPGNSRARRLLGDEESRLLASAEESYAKNFTLAIKLAILTGMRGGELVQLEWSQVDLENHTISLSLTKNGDARVVPLFKAAADLLRAVPRLEGQSRLFEFHDTNGLGAAFRRCCERANIENLHFHDLRHEAASRLAPHVPATALCKLMGWRSVQMAMRYYNQLTTEAVNLLHEIENKVVRAAV